MRLTLFMCGLFPGGGQFRNLISIFRTGRLTWWAAIGAKAKKLQPRKHRSPRLEADPPSMGLSRWDGAAPASTKSLEPTCMADWGQRS